MVGVTNLLLEAQDAGLTVFARGDQLVVQGRRHLADLAERLLAHKAELLPILRCEMEEVTTIQCPWCSGAELIDDRSGLWCENCECLAWVEVPGRGIVRSDCVDDEIIDPPDPCPACGGLDYWWDVADRRHCEQCEPRSTGPRVRQLAKRLRK